MLVVFSSPATDSITMFSDAAVELLKLMGATGRVPGALSAPDVPAALARLEAAVQRAQGRSPAPQRTLTASRRDVEEDEREREPPIAIATRAVPLIDLMKRAAAANAVLVWESR